MEDQTLAEKMPFVIYCFKKQHRENSFQLESQTEKKKLHFLSAVEPPQIVCGFPNHHPPARATGRAGAATAGFIQRVGTDFKAPSGSQTPGLCYSHLFTWTELLGYLQNCGRERSQILWSQCVHCLECSLPPGCYFYVTHVFFFLCVSMRKHPRKQLSVPQQLEPTLGGVFLGIKEARWVRWGSGGFEHAHIVSVKGQAAP